MAFNIMDAIKNREQIAPPEPKQNGRMKIQYISVRNIVPALGNRNYYSTEKIESLKASITVHGVKQNLLVKAIEGGKYELIAGECRWRCSSALFEEGKPEFEFVPCSVERPADDLDQRILLTTLNSTAREISDYEKGLQVQEMNEILDEYERRGATIEAPRRELLMKHLNLTSGQIGRYTAIHNHLSEIFMREYVKKEISVSVAYELSRLSEEEQAEAYGLYEKQGGLSIKDVKAFQNIEEVHEQGSPEVVPAQMDETDVKSDSAPVNTDADYWDEYGRLKATKYNRAQRYKEHDKIIEIKDKRLPEGGFRIYLVQDKEDGLWRSSAARGFIEVGGGRWPHRDADNPANSKTYPAFETMEKALEYAADTMFRHCNDEQKEILNSFGYKEIPAKSIPEKSWENMTPCEQCRAANPQCDELHCCKICEEACNTRQICRIDNPPEKRQAEIDEYNRRTQERLRAASESKEPSGQEGSIDKDLLQIEAAKYTMGVLEKALEKCNIELQYATEQGKAVERAIAVAKISYLGAVMIEVQKDLFDMTGDDMFKEQAVSKRAGQ